MAYMAFDPKQFTTQKAKPLPVILMLDTSGSMDIITNPDEVRRTGRTGVVDGQNVEFVEGGITRISVLNDSVRKMLKTLAKYERDNTEFLVAIITFGEDVRLVLPPSPAADVRFTDLNANGNTPLGNALAIAKNLIEDRAQIPSRAYRPLVILVSDGLPDAGWETAFENFIHNGRSAKCDRMALAIGKEADRDMLGKFVEGTGHSVAEADTAEEITKFFKFVTMSTVQRTLAQDPNQVPKDANVEQPQVPGGGNSGEQQKNPPDDPPDDEEGYW